MTKLKLKRCFQPISHPANVSSVLLLLRLIVGAAFVIHGWGKIQNPMGWMGPQAPVPGFFQLLSAISEFGGGLAYILGLLMPLAALGMVFNMSVAVLTHLVMLKDPFVSAKGGSSYELALVFWGTAILFLVAGPGKLSLDLKAFGKRK